jgi:hypothetical protein
MLTYTHGFEASGPVFTGAVGTPVENTYVLGKGMTFKFELTRTLIVFCKI